MGSDDGEGVGEERREERGEGERSKERRKSEEHVPVSSSVNPTRGTRGLGLARSCITRVRQLVGRARNCWELQNGYAPPVVRFPSSALRSHDPTSRVKQKRKEKRIKPSESRRREKTVKREKKARDYLLLVLRAQLGHLFPQCLDLRLQPLQRLILDSDDEKRMRFVSSVSVSFRSSYPLRSFLIFPLFPWFVLLSLDAQDSHSSSPVTRN